MARPLADEAVGIDAGGTRATGNGGLVSEEVGTVKMKVCEVEKVWRPGRLEESWEYVLGLRSMKGIVALAEVKGY